MNPNPFVKAWLAFSLWALMLIAICALVWVSDMGLPSSIVLGMVHGWFGSKLVNAFLKRISSLTPKAPCDSEDSRRGAGVGGKNHPGQ